MTYLRTLPSAATMAAYRASLTGERLGWVLFDAPSSFRHEHAVLVDPEQGPVAILGDEVWEIDLNDTIYPTETAARETYWARVGHT